MGRWCTLIGVGISIGTAYLAMQFASIMDYVQALFGFFIAPLFGTVLLGMMWKRVTKAAGFWGLLAGTTSSITMFLLMHSRSNERWVSLFALSPEAKGLAQDMYQSLWSCVTCVVVTVLVTLITRPRPDEELRGLVYSLTDVAKEEHTSLFHKPFFWGMVALALLAVLQIIFW
jgi:SSS family solute:Na+ symporter